MRVAVLGAGVAGLVAALRLVQAGHRVDVLERWPGLGGQAATLDLGDGALVERYYHHLFTSDAEMAALCSELGVELERHPSSVAMFAEGRLHAFTTPLDLLRYRPLSPPARLRMGVALLALRRKALADVEDRTARAWAERAMGAEAYEKVWGPLLRGKFHDRADDVGLAFLWSRLRVRRSGGERQEFLLYPQGSFEAISTALERAITAGGGRVLIDRPAARVEPDGGGLLVTAGAPGSFRRGHDPRDFPADGDAERYDAVVATVPSRVFEHLCAPGLLPEPYLERLRGVEHLAALCLLLELDRPFHDAYWTNIADPELPFIGLIEQTNLVAPERYGGRRLLYVANYLPQDDPLLGLDADGLLRAYAPGLTRVRPDFDPAWVRRAWAFREPDAQPVVLPGHRRRMPPFETGVPGLLLANQTQVYPEDRGTNYAVRLGEQVARRLVDGR